jgi:muramoyltetrapeptide carboxypeptidase
MIHPGLLRAGSRVAVVAPAGPIDPELLAHGVGVLESWGLEVEVGKHVLDRHPRLPYLAGRDADRAAEFQRAWCDPDIDAVVCARGGYGCLRMVDLLDWSLLAQARPKVFVGSSDVTALHQAIGSQLGQVTLFGALIAGKLFDAPAQKHLHAMLFSPSAGQVLTGPSSATFVGGVAEGVLAGGNLSLLAAGLAGPDARPPSDAIVLLEDVGEFPYRLDRLITQLLRAGWFTGVSGIALGSWVDCGPPSEVADVLTDLLGSLGIPTVWELGFGHCPGQLSIPLGVRASLNADEGTLTLLE